MDALNKLFESISPGRQVHDPEQGEEDEALARRAEDQEPHAASDVDLTAQQAPEEKPSESTQQGKAGSSQFQAEEGD